MTELTESTLSELERLEREGTQGPWSWNEDWAEITAGPHHANAIVRTDSGIYPPHENDRDLIIALRNNAPALIASARALAESRAECERLREALESCATWFRHNGYEGQAESLDAMRGKGNK